MAVVKYFLQVCLYCLLLRIKDSLLENSIITVASAFILKIFTDKWTVIYQINPSSSLNVAHR